MTTKRKRSPARGSIRWYEEQWRIVLSAKTKGGREELIKDMAKLSYSYGRLQERMDAIEEALAEQEERFWTGLHSVAMAQEQTAERSERARDGMVKINSVPHLRECRQVTTPGSVVCTCGSLPKRFEKPN